jgi:antitoxin (DNA-binding transcriptional repressor) of toxin-antitoxin stability system
MRTAQVSELKEHLDDVIAAVKNGETVEIREGDDALAEFVPRSNSAVRPEPAPSDQTPPNPDQTALEAHLDKLVREGKARRGTGTLPDDFFTRPRPRFEGGGVLDQLLRDRRED